MSGTVNLDIDLASSQVTVTRSDVELSIHADMPSIDIGVPGLTGNPGGTGATGLVKVTHGADPNVARPNAPLVYWVGTVQPTHADPDDLLLLKGA